VSRILPKGTVVTCLSCKNDIYKLASDVNLFDHIEASQFADNGYGVPKDGDRADCPVCGSNLIPTLTGMFT
jgi:hypothetical protein